MWHKIGLKGNIFFTRPLEINKYDRKLLIGRDDEIQDLIREINSVDRGIRIITGRYGIGKTSLLNITQLEVFQNNTSYKRLLPAYRKIRLDNDTRYKDFILEVILALCENIREYYIQSNQGIPDSIKFQVDYWLGIKRNINSSGREIEIDLQLIKMKSNTNLTDMIWNRTDTFYSLRNLLEEFIQETDVTGVFFHIDNLELVQNDSLIEILDNSRDTIFGLENVYWFLCSSDDSLPNEIYIKSPRFSSIISGHSLNLAKLNSSDVIRAIESRIEASKLDENSKINLPFTEDVVRNIYAFTNYDLRESFKIFQYLVSEFFSYGKKISEVFMEGNIQLDFFMIRDTLIEYCLKYTEFIPLTRKECELLDYIFLSSPCSIQSIKKQNIFSNSTINPRLKKMLSYGLIKFETKSTINLTFRLKTIALASRLSKKANNIASREILLAKE